ncbi:hypothetical protein Ade02nite_68190 [Paractinoplanes deccanensis]|uniref:Uncharacterized protein n=1 Tax=Paractinoplanes deccanensis TaxID=113561 RepID=A0ABQ3YDX6_9ACTN|nr:hypothetical protein [Actinoplanes deccanensis]GID78178.1 hypothetical protein Ade02nite_68190 [Actinoplanes deccanensis]
MFPYSDPHIQLDLHHQRVAELIDRASARRLAHSASPPRERSGRWPRLRRRAAAVA